MAGCRRPITAHIHAWNPLSARVLSFLMAAISILMPAYNHARFLPTSIASVLAQSDPDWELLIMDDNSSDQTWDVLQIHIAIPGSGSSIPQ